MKQAVVIDANEVREILAEKFVALYKKVNG